LCISVKQLYMYKIIAFLFLFQISFGQIDPEVTKVEYKDSIIETKKFYIGDVDNDKIKDYAISIASINKETNDVFRNSVDVKFSNNNEIIRFYPSNGIYITTIEDLNNDTANEIKLFSSARQGLWQSISIWTFKNGIWKKISETKGFCSDYEDFLNRVVKINDEYFVIGEDWDLDEKGDFKKIKTKLNSK
jgi:hypothetical protein